VVYLLRDKDFVLICVEFLPYGEKNWRLRQFGDKNAFLGHLASSVTSKRQSNPGHTALYMIGAVWSGPKKAPWIIEESKGTVKLA